MVLLRIIIMNASFSSKHECYYKKIWIKYYKINILFKKKYRWHIFIDFSIYLLAIALMKPTQIHIIFIKSKLYTWTLCITTLFLFKRCNLSIYASSILKCRQVWIEPDAILISFIREMAHPWCKVQMKLTDWKYH